MPAGSDVVASSRAAVSGLSGPYRPGAKKRSVSETNAGADSTGESGCARSPVTSQPRSPRNSSTTRGLM